MSTHAIAVTGAGSTVVGATTLIGAGITLPAGGPWLIHHIWGQVAKVTTAANEGSGGDLLVRSVSGDIDPDIAPGVYPLVGSPIAQGATPSTSENPLNLWPVDWQGAGKAVLSLSYRNRLAITTASMIAAGVIFGTERPEVKPLKFCDGVFASFASALEQQIGTITLSEKATRIVGICADLNKGDALTSGEEVMATIRLDSADVKLPPSQYPCNRAFNAALGAAIGQAGGTPTNFIPVNIDVIGGSRINIFATTTRSVTGNADLSVYLAYE
ncbi:MAG: hypothetical protein WAO71_05345 [Gallionella sp.]